MEAIVCLKVFSCFFLFGTAILIYRHQYSEGYNLIRKWAERGGYRIVRFELRSFRRGPFTLKDAKNQNVYYVIVLDSHGKQRSGYACCGGFRNGVKSEHIEFRWDKAGR